MTVNTTARSVTYLGNDATRTWPFAFRVLQKSDLIVTLITDGVETPISPANFTVTSLPADSGTITYPLTGYVPSGTSIRIDRVVDLVQPTQFDNQGGYFAKSIEGGLDRLTMAQQQLKGDMDQLVVGGLTVEDKAKLDAIVPGAVDAAGARAAVVDNAIGAATTKAPSQAAVATALADKIALAQKGAANGVATLGGDSLVPPGQLPAATTSTQGALSATDKTQLDGLAGTLSGLSSAIAAKIASSEKGAVSGVATLDGSSKVPVAQLPAATTSTAGTLSGADKTKLDGVAAGATANSADATLKDRANHTGSQAQSTVTNLVTDLSAKSALSFAAGQIATTNTVSPVARTDSSRWASKTAVAGKDFGIAADGSTNDAPVINAIMAALAERGGGVLELPTSGANISVNTPLDNKYSRVLVRGVHRMDFYTQTQDPLSVRIVPSATFTAGAAVLKHRSPYAAELGVSAANATPNSGGGFQYLEVYA